MPTKEELDAMAQLFGYDRFDSDTMAPHTIARIVNATIAAKQADKIASIEEQIVIAVDIAAYWHACKRED